MYIYGANSGSKYTEVDSNRRLEHRNRRRKSEETKYMVISINIQGRQNSDYTYVRVKTFPRLDPIIIDDNIDNNQSILRGKGYPRSNSVYIWSKFRK